VLAGAFGPRLPVTVSLAANGSRVPSHRVWLCEASLLADCWQLLTGTNYGETATLIDPHNIAVNRYRY
jgi:hypothetical protein